jgi:TetR/AcrR family transcriptional regulator, lmrAB and yxaGH operons repressor
MLELIQTCGYSGAGLTAVVDRASAPKGSLYFHFPEGKESLGEQAVALAAERYAALFTEATSTRGSAGDVLAGVLHQVAAMLVDQDFRIGCPVSVVTLEMGADSARLREACSSAFDSWIDAVAAYLVGTGVEAARAKRLALSIIGSIEGAIIISRARRSVEPLEAAAATVRELVDRPDQARVMA